MTIIRSHVVPHLREAEDATEGTVGRPLGKEGWGRGRAGLEIIAVEAAHFVTNEVEDHFTLKS